MFELISDVNILQLSAGFIGNIINSVGEWFIGFFCDGAKLLLDTGMGVYNSLAKHAVELLSKSPESFSGSGMSYVTSLANGSFYVLGTALVAVFFLIGFFSESIDIKSEMRLETLLKGLIKFSVAEYFVINALPLSKKLFAFVGALVGSNTTVAFSLPPALNAALTAPIENGVNVGGAIGCFFLGLLSTAVLIVCGLILCYSAYTRFFKIMIMLPYGVLANSTLAGNRTIQHTAVSYWKHMLGVILEAVTMIIAIGLSAKMFSSGGLRLFSADGISLSVYCNYMMIEMIFCPLITVGIVKGAGQLTSKVLGL